MSDSADDDRSRDATDERSTATPAADARRQMPVVNDSSRVSDDIRSVIDLRGASSPTVFSTSSDPSGPSPSSDSTASVDADDGRREPKEERPVRERRASICLSSLDSSIAAWRLSTEGLRRGPLGLLLLLLLALPPPSSEPVVTGPPVTLLPALVV